MIGLVWSPVPCPVCWEGTKRVSVSWRSANTHYTATGGWVRSTSWRQPPAGTWSWGSVFSSAWPHRSRWAGGGSSHSRVWTRHILRRWPDPSLTTARHCQDRSYISPTQRWSLPDGGFLGLRHPEQGSSWLPVPQYTSLPPSSPPSPTAQNSQCPGPGWGGRRGHCSFLSTYQGSAADASYPHLAGKKGCQSVARRSQVFSCAE